MINANIELSHAAYIEEQETVSGQTKAKVVRALIGEAIEARKKKEKDEPLHQDN